jgi:hypothetical protein
MKSVVIHSNHPNDEINTSLMIMLLDAVFGNRRHIRELECQCRVAITKFSRHMQSTMLTTLDIHFLSASEYTPSKRNVIEAAFRSSCSLQSLCASIRKTIVQLSFCMV